MIQAVGNVFRAENNGVAAFFSTFLAAQDWLFLANEE